jgi:hypothetical protein
MTAEDEIVQYSGSKEADDFIDQQGELLPHNAPATKPKPEEVKLQPEIAKEDPGDETKNTLVSTVPPPNDLNGDESDLYPGNREVIFVGKTC